MRLRDLIFIPGLKFAKPELVKDRIVYANHVARILSYILDILVASILIRVLLERFWHVNLPIALEAIAQNPTLQVTGIDPSILLIISTIYALYFTIFLILPWQATPGQMLMGIAVVSISNPQGKLLPSQAFLRFVLSNMVIIPTMVGLFSILATKHKVAVHDVLCDTRVVFVHPTVNNAKDTWLEKQMQRLWQLLLKFFLDRMQ